MPAVEITSKKQFDDLVAKTPFVALQAHATWCGPCKAISPIFEGLSKDLAVENQYAFAKFDVDDVSPLASELGISSIPAFFFFKNGEKETALRGANPKALQEAAKHLGEQAAAEAKAFSTTENF